jgi:2,3-bisphosphoglycerate-dependent phosphoglycerate mutase
MDHKPVAGTLFRRARIADMQRLYVVAHPEATHHVDRLVGGWYDSPLTDRGAARAEQIAGFLRVAIPRDAVTQLVSSDLTRTAQTAAVIGAALDVEVEFDADLREKSYGVAEGRPQSWLDQRFIFPPAQGERLEHDEGIEGGETKRAWVERAHAAMARIERIDAEHRVIVTHGGTASCVITAWMRIPPAACAYAAFKIPSGSVTVLEEDDRFHNRTLVTLGERDF